MLGGMTDTMQCEKKADRRTSRLLSVILALFFFWTGLGVGPNMSDVKYWYESTWWSIYLEWTVMLLYVLIVRKLPDIKALWGQYRVGIELTVAWAVWVLLSYLFSSYYDWQNPLARMRLVETYTHMLFFFFLWDCFQRYDIDFRMIFASLIAATLVVMGYFVYIHFTYPGLVADCHVFSIRSKHLLINTHVHRIGYQVETALVFLTAFLMMRRYRILTFAVLIALSLFLVWLGGRAAMLGTGSAFAVLLYQHRAVLTWKKALLVVVLLMIGVVTSTYFHLFDKTYLLNAINKTVGASSLDMLTTGRMEVWGLAIEKLEGHWWLGTGPQSYFFYPHRHPEVIHAHNFILQFLGEWGIVGTVLFLMLLSRGFVRNKREECQMPVSANIHRAAGLAIMSLLVTGVFSGVFYFFQTILYFALAFAIWVTTTNIRQQNIANV